MFLYRIQDSCTKVARQPATYFYFRVNLLPTHGHVLSCKLCVKINKRCLEKISTHISFFSD